MPGCITSRFKLEADHFNPVTMKTNMTKSTFIPAPDHDFLVWINHFIANLTRLNMA
jgi:hypothetical protein